MNEIDELFAHRELAEANKAEVESRLVEIENLCKMANRDVVSSGIYHDYIAKLRNVCEEINHLDCRIAEIERESIESRVRVSVGSDNVEEVLEFVL